MLIYKICVIFLQFSTTLDDLKNLLKQTEFDKTDLKYLSDSTFEFCNTDESNLTKLLMDFSNNLTTISTVGNTSQEQNQVDMDRLKTTFEALSRKEMQIKLEKCSLDAQVELLCDLENGILQKKFPDSDCLEK